MAVYNLVGHIKERVVGERKEKRKKKLPIKNVQGLEECLGDSKHTLKFALYTHPYE